MEGGCKHQVDTHVAIATTKRAAYRQYMQMKCGSPAKRKDTVLDVQRPVSVGEHRYRASKWRPPKHTENGHQIQENNSKFWQA